MRICAGGALGHWCPYRDSKYGSKRCLGRTEADRKITSEPWSSKRGLKKNQEDHSSEGTEKYAQKEFDRADIVRDFRLRDLNRSYRKFSTRMMSLFNASSWV